MLFEHMSMRGSTIVLKALIAGVAAVIVYFALVYQGQLPDHRWLRGWNDTFLHVSAFGLLTLLVLPVTNERLAPLAILAACAVAIEGLQLSDPGRSASLGDIFAGATGIALAAGVYSTAGRLFRRRRAKVGEQEC